MGTVPLSLRERIAPLPDKSSGSLKSPPGSPCSRASVTPVRLKKPMNRCRIRQLRLPLDLMDWQFLQNGRSAYPSGLRGHFAWRLCRAPAALWTFALKTSPELANRDTTPCRVVTDSLSPFPNRSSGSMSSQPPCPPRPMSVQCSAADHLCPPGSLKPALSQSGPRRHP